MACVASLLVLAGAAFVMLSLLRWFEQTVEAVEMAWWSKVFVLIACPFVVWFYPSRVAAGRPMPVPRHEPVRGFGAVPKVQKGAPGGGNAGDGPPPGTPPAFIGIPKIPAPKTGMKPALDPEKIAQLRRKMREQGMLPKNEE